MRISASPKRLIGLILSLFVALTGLVAIDAQPSRAAGDKRVIIHYQKPDPTKYNPWNVWMWYDGADGKAYEFDKSGANYILDDYGAKGTWDLPNSASAQSIGFIIRTANWDKDPDGDRFIRNFVDRDGVPTAEIWVKSGSKFIWTKKPSSEPMLLAARVTGLKEIKLTFDNNFNLETEKANFELRDSLDQPVAIASWSAITGNASIGFTTTMNLVENVRIGSVYTVSHPNYGEQESDLGSLWNLQEFNDQYYYSGNDLGNTYSAEKTDFRVWAPTSDQLQLVTYSSASATEPSNVYNMTQDVKGTWVHTLNGNQDGTIYMYRAKFGTKVNEAIDPYVRATTINGDRGVVVDLESTDPVGWDEHQRPNNFSTGNPTDAIVYELHVRDLSIDKTSGVSAANKGKYLAFTEPNTKYTSKGKTTLTGLSSIKDLGVTHVELLPIYDFGSVDETGQGNQFNWGYDPKNYNVPEGSYSSNAADPKARIRELKTAIKSMHDNKLRVIMDVVYNHVQDSTNFSFEKLVPGYWYRRDATGVKTSGSGCGNDTATENPMVSKYIQDSVRYWTEEYKMDGYRFDLMGLIDITTMNAIRTQLNDIDPTIITLGEGWDMGTLPRSERATFANSAKIPGIATFNAIIRDGMKGGVWANDETGWISGRYGQFASIQSGIVGNAPFPGLAGEWIGGIEPSQTVNYIESHDNATFFDKLKMSLPKSTPTSRIVEMQKLGTAIVFVSQGIPFIQAGQEFMRTKWDPETKTYNKNSYNSTDVVNSLKWADRLTYASQVNYIKGMISLRKAHKAFRMTSADKIMDNIEFLDGTFGQLGWKINGKAAGDSWSNIVVLANSNPTKTATFNVPKGSYKVVVDKNTAGTKTLRTLNVTGKSTGKVTVPALSMMVIWK